MNLEDMKGAVILLTVIAMIGAATAIAISGFQDQITPSQNYLCGTNGSYEFNITCSGEEGLKNTTNYLGTIGTIIGVAVLIGIVVLAFTFVRK